MSDVVAAVIKCNNEAQQRSALAPALASLSGAGNKKSVLKNQSPKHSIEVLETKKTQNSIEVLETEDFSQPRRSKSSSSSTAPTPPLYHHHHHHHLLGSSSSSSSSS
jgi:hypothetical protein